MTVSLIERMGSDLTIVNSARVSYQKASKRFSDDDDKLLRFLAKNRHGTPFEHTGLILHVKTSIKVAREWFRHRIGSFNEVSTRYVEMKPDFYVPEPDHVRTQVGRPGAYHFETITDVDVVDKILEEFEQAYANAYASYEKVMQLGGARELASFLLPMGLMTEFYWTVNFRSISNFLSLRTAPSALFEIRDEAAEVERIVAAEFPAAYKAWCDGGRQSL